MVRYKNFEFEFDIKKGGVKRLYKISEIRFHFFENYSVEIFQKILSSKTLRLKSGSAAEEESFRLLDPAAKINRRNLKRSISKCH